VLLLVLLLFEDFFLVVSSALDFCTFIFCRTGVSQAVLNGNNSVMQVYYSLSNHFFCLVKLAY
jgi:hypothetical protein